MTGKGNILSPNEVNQSYVRTINTLLITIYIFYLCTFKFKSTHNKLFNVSRQSI